MWPIKAAAQSSRRVKCFLNNLRARMGRVPSGVGLKARNELKKKYPLIISDERVLPSHLNLMTLGNTLVFFFSDDGMAWFTYNSANDTLDSSGASESWTLVRS